MKELLSRGIGVSGGGALYQVLMVPFIFHLIQTGNAEAAGKLGAFIASTSLLGVVASLRIEHAVAVAPHKKEANEIFYLALLVLGLSSVVLSLVWGAFFAGGWFDFVLLYCGIVGVSALEAFTFRFIRTEQFYVVSVAKLVSCAVFFSIAAVSFSPVILILAYIGDKFAGLVVFSVFGWRKNVLTRIDSSVLKGHFLGVREFMTFGVVGTVLNAVALQAPVIYLEKFAGSEAAGMFFAATRVLTAAGFFTVVGARLFYHFGSKRVREKQPLGGLVSSITLVSVAALSCIPIFCLLTQKLSMTGIFSGWAEIRRDLLYLSLGFVFSGPFSIISASALFLKRLRALALLQGVFAALMAAGLSIHFVSIFQIEFSVLVGSVRAVSGLLGLVTIFWMIRKFDKSLLNYVR